MKVIKRTNMPQYYPLSGTATTFLLLDRFGAPFWLWIVSGFFVILLWVSITLLFINETEIDVLENIEG